MYRFFKYNNSFSIQIICVQPAGDAAVVCKIIDTEGKDLASAADLFEAKVICFTMHAFVLNV